MKEKEYAESLASELIEEWTYGTDLKDRLSDEVLKDLHDKAAKMFFEMIQK